jgi:hypothetical protein
VLAELALLLAQAALVAVRPGPDLDCPSARQVAEALRARLPDVVVPSDRAGGPNVLLLSLSGGDGSAPAFVLTDNNEHVRLRRSLPGVDQRERDCGALADSVALIVERYLQDLDYPEPPAAPVEQVAAPAPAPVAARRWDLFAGGSWRAGESGGAALPIAVGAGRTLMGAPLRIGASLAGSMTDRSWIGGGSGTLRRLSLALDASLYRRAGPGRLEGGVYVGTDLLWLDGSAGGRTQSELRPEPVAGLVAGYRLWFGRLFARPVVGAGLVLVRHAFTAGGDGQVAFATSRVYGKLGVELGLGF